MRVVKDSMREFNKFISDEGLERILGRVLDLVDVEGIVQDVREQIQKEALTPNPTTMSGREVEQSFKQVLEKRLAGIVDAVNKNVQERKDEIKKDLRNFIVYVVRNGDFKYDGGIRYGKKEAMNSLYYSIVAPIRLAFIPNDIIDEVNERLIGFELNSHLKDVIFGICRDVSNDIDAIVRANCEKVFSALEQVVRSLFSDVEFKLERLERSVEGLFDMLEKSALMEELFGGGTVRYIADAFADLHDMIDKIAGYKD